jgi:hypothetical protein
VVRVLGIGSLKYHKGDGSVTLRWILQRYTVRMGWAEEHILLKCFDISCDEQTFRFYYQRVNVVSFVCSRYPV